MWDWLCKADEIAVLLTLAVEVIGVVLVVVTLRKDKKIKQAEFIMNYNFHFISSEPLIEMERKFENCYQIYRQEAFDYKNSPVDMQLKVHKKLLHKMKRIVGFAPVSNKLPVPVTRKYQKLINYLVYLESFAPLVLTEQVALEDIDDTFGYRYFIAMNNPIVQTYELLPEADYYCGCLKLYQKWFDYRKQNGKTIPMEWYSLSHTEKTKENPLNPVYLAREGEELKDNYIKNSKVRIRKWKK